MFYIVERKLVKVGRVYFFFWCCEVRIFSIKLIGSCIVLFKRNLFFFCMIDECFYFRDEYFVFGNVMVNICYLMNYVLKFGNVGLNGYVFFDVSVFL